MTIQNRDVVEILKEVADLLDISDANAFRVRAYRNASRTIADLDRQIAEMVDNDEDISSLPDVGESIAEKVREIVRTGSLSQLEKLRDQMDADVTQLLRIPNVGPARAGTLYRELGLTDAQGLIEAAENGEIAELDGFGEKTQQQLADDARRYLKSGLGERTPLGEVDAIVEPLIEYLEGLDQVSAVKAAGSYRRRKETVGDIDILTVCTSGTEVMNSFSQFDRVDRVLSKGETRSSVVLKSGIQVDLRAVAKKSYGAALYYFTGSKDHNVAVRRIAQDAGLKINEYGVFRDDEQIAGETEESVFQAIDLPYIVPELREDRGEIDAARGGNLPNLITRDDFRGDLHMHSTATDGKNSIREMAKAGKDLGYRYIAITDHSKRSRMTNGLNEDRLLKQIDEIAALNDELDIRILSGIEVDILEDGSLDLPDEVLERLDVVIGSVHYKREMSSEKMTRRVLKAMDNPTLSILGHPTGRMLSQREAHDMDLDRVLEGAGERGVLVELNANPERLDLNDVACRAAAERGVKIAIGTDAHSTGGLGFMRYGVDTARRGWLARDNVANTRDTRALLKLLER